MPSRVINYQKKCRKNMTLNEIVEQLKNDMSSRINKSGRVIGTGMLIHS